MSDFLLAHERDTPVWPRTLLHRACGVLIAPVRTFASVQQVPRWFDVLLLAAAIVGTSTYVFTASDRGATLAVERRVTFSESAGRRVSAEEFADLVLREQRDALRASVVASVWLVGFTPIIAIGALALVSLLIAMGALQAPIVPAARFRQALAVTAHSAIILAIGVPIRLLCNIWLGSIGPATSIGVMIPFLPEDTIWAHLGNCIDLFGLWWARTLAIGFAMLCLGRPDGLRPLFLGIYLASAIALAIARTLVGVPSY